MPNYSFEITKVTETGSIMLFAFKENYKTILIIGNDQTTTRLTSGSGVRRLNNENGIQTNNFNLSKLPLIP